MRTALTIAGSDSILVEKGCALALYLVPDLHLFSVSGGRVNGQAVSVLGDFVSWGYVGLASGYALLYIAVLLGASIAVFARRDFV